MEPVLVTQGLCSSRWWIGTGERPAGEGAWFGFLEEFMWDVFIPNGELFMVVVVVFELSVGAALLGRGRWVDVGVVASVGWVLVVLPFLAWPYLLTNVVLAVVQGVVLLRRHERAAWDWRPRPPEARWS